MPPNASSRLIPTCVGSTLRAPAGFSPCPAHPHVCGEHLTKKFARVYNLGSSPRVWGAPLESLVKRVAARLIPTCVGSTHRVTGAAPWWTAHPHVCGEHLNSLEWRSPPCGSSPRVWGAHEAYRERVRSTRLIPTCVGSTIGVAIGGAATAAHPHVCGEHEPTR